MKSAVEFPKRLIPRAWRKGKDTGAVDAIEHASEYLQKNQLTDVAVFVNDYDPAGQWQRLRENSRIAPLGATRWECLVGPATR